MEIIKGQNFNRVSGQDIEKNEVQNWTKQQINWKERWGRRIAERLAAEFQIDNMRGEKKERKDTIFVKTQAKNLATR